MVQFDHLRLVKQAPGGGIELLGADETKFFSGPSERQCTSPAISENELCFSYSEDLEELQLRSYDGACKAREWKPRNVLFDLPQAAFQHLLASSTSEGDTLGAQENAATDHVRSGPQVRFGSVEIHEVECWKDLTKLQYASRKELRHAARAEARACQEAWEFDMVADDDEESSLDCPCDPVFPRKHLWAAKASTAFFAKWKRWVAMVVALLLFEVLVKAFDGLNGPILGPRARSEDILPDSQVLLKPSTSASITLDGYEDAWGHSASSPAAVSSDNRTSQEFLRYRTLSTHEALQQDHE